MDGDDLAPNDSEALGVYEPDVPEETQEDERAEQSKVSLAQPFIEEVLEWFDTNIKVADSVTQAKMTAAAHNVSLETAVIAHDVVAMLLKAERDALETRYSQKEDDE
jgi:hypothetical protein